MAVYDEQTGYYTSEYNNIGDPFFSECADYTAQITLPEGYLIAPTGTITGETHQEGQVTYKVDGENRRDFGFVASDDLGAECQGSVNVYVPHDKKDLAIDDGQFYDSTQLPAP